GRLIKVIMGGDNVGSVLPQVLATGLLAVSPFHVLLERTARAYALGTCLVVFSSWILLHLLQEREKRLLWWLVYALLASALAYTHYYSLFTLAAHASLACGAVVLLIRMDRYEGMALIKGVSVAALVVLLLYTPWLPSMLKQMRSVQEGFWIPRLTRDNLV